MDGTEIHGWGGFLLELSLIEFEDCQKDEDMKATSG